MREVGRLEYCWVFDWLEQSRRIRQILTSNPKWKNKKILITGGAGFLGSHLVEAFVAEGANVTVMDNFATGAFDNLALIADRLQLIRGDILSMNWMDVLRQHEVEFFFHLVGNAHVPASVENPEMDFTLNLRLAFDILESLRKVSWPGRFIFPSSAAVYGNPKRLPICEEDWTVPISPYGVSKQAVERYMSVYHDIYGLKTASLRLFSVYGPRQRKLVVYDLITKIINDPQNVYVHGNGEQVRDFLFIKDAVRAMMTVAWNGKFTGEVYNTASGAECTILELIQHISQVLEVNPRVTFSGSVRPGEPEKWSVDVSRLAGLGFVPSHSLQNGLEQTIAWIKSL